MTQREKINRKKTFLTQQSEGCNASDGENEIFFLSLANVHLCWSFSIYLREVSICCCIFFTHFTFRGVSFSISILVHFLLEFVVTVNFRRRIICCYLRFFFIFTSRPLLFYMIVDFIII